METNSGLDEVSMFGLDRVQAHRDQQYSTYHNQSRGNNMFVTIVSAPRTAENRYILGAEGVQVSAAPKSLNRWVESTKAAIGVTGSTVSATTIDLGSGMLLDMFVMQLSTKGSVDQLAQSIVINRIQQRARAAGAKVSQFLINLGLTGIAVSDKAPSEHDFAFTVHEIFGDYPEELNATVLGVALANQASSVAVIDLPLSQLGVPDGYAVLPMDIDINDYPSLQEDAMLDELDVDGELNADDLDLEAEEEGEDFSDTEEDHSEEDDDGDASAEEDHSEDESQEEAEEDESQEEQPEEEDAAFDDPEGDDDSDLMDAVADAYDEENQLAAEEDEDSLTLIPVSIKPRLIFIMDNNEELADHYAELSDLHGFNFVAPVASPSRDPQTRKIVKPAGYLREPLKVLAADLSGLTKEVQVLSSQYERTSELLLTAAVNTATQAVDNALYLMHGLVEDDQDPSEVEFTLGGFEEEGGDTVTVSLADLVDSGVAVVGDYLNVYVRAFFPRFYSDKAQATLDSVRKIFKRISDESGLEIIVGFTEKLSAVFEGHAISVDLNNGAAADGLTQAFTAYTTGCVFDAAEPVKLDSDGVDFESHEDIFTADPNPSSANVDLGMFGNYDLLVLVSERSDTEE
jgi:hypothetical protein